MDETRTPREYSASQPPPGAVRRQRLTLLRVLLLPLLWAAVEIGALIAVAGLIGWGWALLALVASSLAGIVLVGVLGRRTLQSVLGALRQGRVPSTEMAEGVLAVAGAALMITPGLVSAVVGLLLIVAKRPLRGAAAAMLARRARRMGTTVSGVHGFPGFDGSGFDGSGFDGGPGRGGAGRGGAGRTDGDVVRGDVIDPDDPRA